MSQTIQRATSLLPPEVVKKAASLGIEPVKIEGSGAMRLRISNTISLSKKKSAIDAFKAVLREYGLDLARVPTDTTSSSVWDASILMIKRNENGNTVPLFNRLGIPIPDEVRSTPSQKRQKAAA